jgi:FkbM family methyltransferase
LIFSRKFLEKVYAFWDSFRLSISGKPLLFVDCGANIGQGYSWFRSYYTSTSVTFDLFEPNPYAFSELCARIPRSEGRVNLHNLAVGLSDGNMRFYGLADHEGGKLSLGGSLLFEHNNKYYIPSSEGAIDVRVVNFPSYVRKRSEAFHYIVIKMDIEGYELDLLEGMIDDGTIKYVDVLYIEFHSQYQDKELSERSILREREILRRLRSLGIKVRLWH